MRKRNVCGLVVLLMAVMSVAGALAWGNRPHAAMKTATHGPAAPAPASSLAARRAKRQTSGNSVTVTHTNDGGPGSLRQAISEANNVPGTTIVFNIPLSDPGFNNAAGVFVIRPLSPLPMISGNGTVIDGVSQTIFTGDTNPVGPEIVINGGLAGASAMGLHIQDAADCVIKGLVINGFSSSGISINGTGAVNNRVSGCFIGTDERGAAAVSNSIDGIVITDGAHNNLIGGGNLISGNGQNGIVLAGAGVRGNRVQSNMIGLNLTGDAAIGNARNGILITNGAQENVIGGTTPLLDGNIISGNGEDGVHISGAGTDDNVVRNSCIGGDRNCAAKIPNGGDGVEISGGAQGNEVGDAANDLGNAIFGNGGNGVFISDNNTTLNRVQRCAIGTNPNNAAGVGNVLNGVLIANGASNNLIGGPGTNQGCVISGNRQNGVRITQASNNAVQGNLIGTDVNGAAALGNSANGVLIDESSQNVIGGAAANEGNRIAHNGLDGVRVTSAAAIQNRILSNLIHDNGGLGINLAGGVEDDFGVTANDPGDADGSPNKLQNFPVLTLAATDGNFTTINGSLDSDPANANYPVLIQFFVSGAADPSGFGEGKQLFASHLLNAPGNFSLNNLPPAPVGAMLTATATDSDGNTSEFSQAISVSAMSAGVAHLRIGATPSVVEVNGEAIIEVQATNNAGNAVSNTNINFQTTGGTLSANADTTDANGRAKVILRQIPFGTTTVTAETGAVRVTVEVKDVLRLGVPAGVSLLSFPVDVAAGQVGELFRGGGVDVARWEPSPLTVLGHYEFFSQQPFDLNAGRGYWIRSDVAQTAEIGHGTLPDPQQPAFITFGRDAPGWDLRGNPSVRDLLFDITRIKVRENGVVIGTLADITRDGHDEHPIVEPYCWKWTNDAAGAGYELVIDPRLLAVLAIPPDIGRAIADTHLEFGRGAFFFLRRSNVALEFPPELQVTRAARVQRTKREPVQPSADNWTIGLQAQAGSIKTGESVIGVSEKMENDLRVKKSPPVTSQRFVDLSLLNETNESLAWDVRAARASKMTWDVLVTTNQTGTVSLTYPNLSRLPKNLRAYVVDPDSGKRQFMRTTTHYAFTANSSGITQKRLRIEVTSETDGKLLVNGLQATVGGGAAARLVRLSFVLNRDAMVRGRVLSPTGKMIRAITPTMGQRGLNVVSWDGKTQRGDVAGRGVYVMELVAEDEEGNRARAVRLVTLR